MKKVVGVLMGIYILLLLSLLYMVTEGLLATVRNIERQNSYYEYYMGD